MNRKIIQIIIYQYHILIFIFFYDLNSIERNSCLKTTKMFLIRNKNRCFKEIASLFYIAFTNKLVVL